MGLMSWLAKARSHSLPATDPRIASAAELNEAFLQQQEHLSWLAEVITGDADMAQVCVVNAWRLSKGGTGVFRDWLVQWARSSTVRSAVHCMREQIAAESEKYSELKCTHGGHPVLAVQEAESLKDLKVAEITSNLDTFSRAVLLLRGVQGCALQDCALTLGVSRLAVSSAYCGAREWMVRVVEHEAAC